MGDRAQLPWNGLSRRRVAVVDPSSPACARERLDRGGALVVALATGMSRVGDYLARHARGAGRNRTDVLRLHAERAREEGAATGGNTCLPGGPVSVNTEALHRHAELVVERELRRARRRLAASRPTVEVKWRSSRSEWPTSSSTPSSIRRARTDPRAGAQIDLRRARDGSGAAGLLMCLGLESRRGP